MSAAPACTCVSVRVCVRVCMGGHAHMCVAYVCVYACVHVRE